MSRSHSSHSSAVAVVVIVAALEVRGAEVLSFIPTLLRLLPTPTPTPTHCNLSNLTELCAMLLPLLPAAAAAAAPLPAAAAAAAAAACTARLRCAARLNDSIQCSMLSLVQSQTLRVVVVVVDS